MLKKSDHVAIRRELQRVGRDVSQWCQQAVSWLPHAARTAAAIQKIDAACDRRILSASLLGLSPAAQEKGLLGLLGDAGYVAVKHRFQRGEGVVPLPLGQTVNNAREPIHQGTNGSDRFQVWIATSPGAVSWTTPRTTLPSANIDNC